MDDASIRQVQAAEPAASTWLSANAGSGKTRVLTDRVARLLLGGVEPQRVLCLTYTKAAASEMQIRLFERLGAWAMLPDDALRAELLALGAGSAGDADLLARARRLFARAIETPGGLKIQTIHSFCAALLRRFPLEAGVTPQFAEIDDRSARLLRNDVLEALTLSDPEAVREVARHFTGESIEALMAEVSRRRAGFATPLDRAGALAMFGLPEAFTEADLLAEVFIGGEADLLAAVGAVLKVGSVNDIKAAGNLSQLSPGLARITDLQVLEKVFLHGKAAAKAGPFTAKLGAFPTKGSRTALGALLDPLEALMRRVEAARPRRLALAAAEKTAALHRFAHAFLPALEARKAAAGWLDFDDLISRARALLTDPGVAQWVLYKLDGGVDHILVDEAQDTSPEQWAVIECLAQEFTSGLGARGTGRTIFVVGDKKQSIYSFQGADLAEFENKRALFSEKLSAIGVALKELTLEHSFRSSAAVLRVVDLCFDERRGAGLGGEVKHLAFFPDMPGRVDLWPVIPPAAKAQEHEWFDPVDMIAEEHHAARLARTIAAEIRRMIAEDVQVPGQKGGARPVSEGDFLILVRRRSALFAEVIRACKAQGLEVAGADRLKLGAEMAVKDIAALLGFLALPEDDLSLAAALRSPLLGWSEDALFRAAHGRGRRHLWQVVRTADPATTAVLEDLLDHADFQRPYDLIERILIRHDGRRRLIARLGAEAEDGIDAFLQQALAYERTEVPSLTGFLSWLETDEVQIKRQLDDAGNRIRVMTVHGAKGLQAPVVILPDTARQKQPDRDELLPVNGQVAWKTTADESPAQLAEARAEAARLRAEEDARLLYVAMTRAESWLIVAAAGEVGGEGGTWYDSVAEAMQAAGALRADLATGEGLRLSHGDWPAPVAERQEAARHAAPELAPWVGRRAALVPDAAPVVLSPSDLGGAKALAGEGDMLDDAAAMRRGRQLHLLLEHLPQWPRADWPDLAADLLAEGEDAATPPELAALLTEAGAVLEAPALAPLFAADALAEVEITADLGAARMQGVIDRLLIGPDRVLAVDYKSNAVVPARPEDVPEGLLRQMAAYAHGLRQVFPDRKVECALLWTRDAALMPLPEALLKRALAAVLAGEDAALP